MLSPMPIDSSTTQHHAELIKAGEHAALVGQDHAAAVEPALPRPHPFPTVRSGGLFVLLVGIATMASTLLSGTPALQGIVFAAGFALAIAIGLVLLRRRLSYGAQTRTQRLAVIGAMGLETVMIVAIVNVVRPQDPRALWLWLFLAVGIHFLPFGLVHGPKMALLGALCVVNALLGLWLAVLPFVVFGFVDGVLKVGLGTLMFLDRPLVVAGWPARVRAIHLPHGAE